MHERHPVEKSPPYHVIIWIVAGIVAAVVVYGLVKKVNVPPAPPLGVDLKQAAALPKIPFTDITAEAGIKFTQFGGAVGEKMLPESGGSGCAFLDYDSDGDADLLLISGKAWEWNRTTADQATKVLALFRNDKGKFTDVTAAAGLRGDFYGQGAAVGDYDADGDDDLVVTALGAIYVYRNDGGKFTDATAGSGIAVEPTDWPTSAGFFDYDHDGRLDLFVVNYVRWDRDTDQKANRRVPGSGLSYAHPENFAGTQNFLFRNDGGRFTDVSAAAGIHVFDKRTAKPLGKGLAVTFVDFDRDGWIDVFVANDTVPHFLFRNRGNGAFEEVAAARHVALSSEGNTTSGMSADTGWLRNNDELVIAVGNFADERTSFFVSSGSGERVMFADESLEAGVGDATRNMLTWGLVFDDFDLDGRVDMAQTNGHLEETIHAVQPNQTYAQRGQLFWNTGAAGPRIIAELPGDQIGDLAKPMVGRALASADIDGDGDLDLLITSLGGTPRLLRNDQSGRNHWLRVKLVGPPGNRHGIGSVIELRSAGVTQRRTLMPTRSYLAQTEATATFGLGNATEIESLNITWPDGGEQTVVVKGVDRVLAVERDIQSFAVLGNLAKGQLENGDYQKAVATLQRALRLKPDSLAMRRNLARARYLWKDHAAALEELRRIDADAPSAATSYLMGLAAYHLAADQKVPAGDAVNYLRRAVELDPNDATLRYQYANALAFAGELDAADEQFRKTIELNPLHGQAQYRLGVRVRRSDVELYRQLMRDYERVKAMKGGQIAEPSLEVCRYTHFETPESEQVAPAGEVAESKFVVANIAPPASASVAERLPALVAIAPLSLEEDGRYQLAGVGAAGELVVIGFDDAGRAKVVARSEQPLGAVGNEAVLLVGNARRDLEGPPDAVDRTRSVPGTLAGDPPEMAIVTPQRSWLVRYQPATGFVDLTEPAGLSAASGQAARWIDLDHDGDIDLCIGSTDGFKVWRNNGDGTFAEKTAEFVLAEAGPVSAMAAADLEGMNLGVDLVLAGPQRTTLWKSDIQGQFLRDIEASAHWPVASQVFADDFNNDSRPDIVLVSTNTLTLASTKGSEQLQVATGIETLDAAVRLDDDNDGRLDVALFGRTGNERKAVLLRNAGGRFAEAVQPLPAGASPRRNGLWAFDIDADCDTDLLYLDEAGQVRALRNELSNGNRQVKMALYSSVREESPIGTRVELRRDEFVAGRWLETELPVEIGVGKRTRVDAVQSLWMNGLARNELDVPVDCKPLRILITQFVTTDSCPFLYAWRDGEWQFMTDLLGIAPLNVAVARGVRMPPDPDEVVVLGPAERFADGPAAARLRISTELREVTYLDEVRLLAVDHPADVTIFSRDRVAMTGVAGKQIIGGRDPVALRAAKGSDGLDRTAALALEDGVFADPGRVIPAPVVGFTEPLSIELEFDELGDTSNLFMALTGWYRFGSSSSNVGAAQRSDIAVIWPRLEVQDAAGEWKLVDDMVGFPAGKTKTIVCDLAGKLPAGARRLRLTSSFEVRWDRLALFHAAPAEQLRMSEVGPTASSLGWHGFHELVAASVDQPTRPNLARASDVPMWYSAVEGWSTRYGDIRSLVSLGDDRLAILNAGDGATLEFPAAGLPAREAGAARTLLLYSVGWVKAGDPNGTSAMTVAPFPGSSAEADATGRDWQLEYNTRWVPRDRFAPSRMRGN